MADSTAMWDALYDVWSTQLMREARERINENLSFIAHAPAANAAHWTRMEDLNTWYGAFVARPRTIAEQVDDTIQAQEQLNGPR